MITCCGIKLTSGYIPVHAAKSTGEKIIIIIILIKVKERCCCLMLRMLLWYSQLLDQHGGTSHLEEQ